MPKLRPCAVCGKDVAKGQGQFYKHKVIHTSCLPKAKNMWNDDSITSN